MSKQKIDASKQKDILRESVRVAEKLKAFPRTLSTDELHKIDQKALNATNEELLKAKHQIQQMEDRLRSILIGGTTVTALGVMSLAIPVNFWVPAATISTGVGIIGGATLLGSQTGVFKNAKEIHQLSKDFLHSLESKPMPLAPKPIEKPTINMMLGDTLERAPELNVEPEPMKTPPVSSPTKPRRK